MHIEHKTILYIWTICSAIESDLLILMHKTDIQDLVLNCMQLWRNNGPNLRKIYGRIMDNNIIVIVQNSNTKYAE